MTGKEIVDELFEKAFYFYHKGKYKGNIVVLWEVSEKTEDILRLYRDVNEAVTAMPQGDLTLYGAPVVVVPDADFDIRPVYKFELEE